MAARLSTLPLADPLDGRRAKHQVEVLFSVVNEVPHLVIDPELDRPSFYMATKETVRSQQVEDDAPARHLGMVIAA